MNEGFNHVLNVEERHSFGEILPLINIPNVRDVLLQVKNGEVQTWVDVGNGLQKIDSLIDTPEQIYRLAQNLVATGGRHVDELNPCTDVRLGSGIRVHAVLEPIVTEGAAISIRIPNNKKLTIMDLFRAGICDTKTAKIMLDAVTNRYNFLISGATATGKTTLLSALLGEVSHRERIISIEDVAELQPEHPHHLALESRQPNSEGIGEVSLDRLLREALRMRPDRIVLGECRGKEVVTLLTALNTGHDGGASTIHANSMDDIPARLETLGAQAGLSPVALARQTVSALHLAIHLTRDGTRHRVGGIGAFALNQQGLLTVQKLESV